MQQWCVRSGCHWSTIFTMCTSTMTPAFPAACMRHWKTEKERKRGSHMVTIMTIKTIYHYAIMSYVYYIQLRHPLFVCIYPHFSPTGPSDRKFFVTKFGTHIQIDYMNRSNLKTICPKHGPTGLTGTDLKNGCFIRINHCHRWPNWAHWDRSQKWVLYKNLPYISILYTPHPANDCYIHDMWQ